MVSVVPSTSAEKRKVQMGSTYLYSGWRGWEKVRTLQSCHSTPNPHCHQQGGDRVPSISPLCLARAG